jgi:hypothetical protein
MAQFAYGIASYAMAIAAALFLATLHRLPDGLLKYFLITLGFAILLFPPLFGSVCIVTALIHLVGAHLDSWSVSFFGLCLWTSSFFAIYFSILHRRTRFQR